jgi:uncharacterized protein involved in exopolysaccharide biosynthesis
VDEGYTGFIVRKAMPSRAEEEPSFDFGQVRDWASYAARAVRRHLLAVLGIALVVLFVAIAASWALPYRYTVEAKLLSQRPDVIAMVSDPGRQTVTPESATGAVTEMVLRRDNLLALVQQTGLVRQYRESRNPVQKARDYLLYGRELTDEEATEVLVGTLEKQIKATAGGDGLVTIAARWNDPETTYRLVDTALTNFLETRHVNEMAMLGESISLLEERLGESERQLEAALASARNVPRPAPRAVSSGGGPALPRFQTSVELARLRAEILAKRRAADDLVTFRERRIAELQAQLAELKAVYSESHPNVVNTRRSLEALAGDSPQVSQLRQQIAELEGRYVSRGGSAAELTEGVVARATGGGGASSSILAALDRQSRDPAEDYARGRLTAAMARYYSVVDRLESAKLQRDAARAEIKFRYIVVKPPLRPRKAANGAVKEALQFAGLLLGLPLGVAVAVLLELRRGRISQRWQVERQLGLPVLAELPARARRGGRE